MSDLMICLERQTFSRDEFEVLLVDNGSNIFNPPDICRSNAQILMCQQPGSYAARNLGIRSAKGEWLVFTDADCLPEPDWLDNVYREVRQHQDVRIVFAGNIEVAPQSISPNAYEIYDMVKGIPQRWYVKQGYAATANLAFHKTLAERLGGFDERLFSGGDVDICRRAAASGSKMVFLSDATVQHRARTSWNDVATKARRIKGGQLRMKSIRRQLLTVARTLLPPVIAMYRFCRTSRYSLRFRVVAIMVQYRIWALELVELVRLAFRGEAERR